MLDFISSPFDSVKFSGYAMFRKLDDKQHKLPEELQRRLGHDLILQELTRDGGHPTVKDYIDLNWGGELPDEIDAEDAEVLDAIARFEASQME